MALCALTQTACTDIADNAVDVYSPSDTKAKTEYSIFVMSDIHVMAPELLVEKGTDSLPAQRNWLRLIQKNKPERFCSFTNKSRLNWGDFY